MLRLILNSVILITLAGCINYNTMSDTEIVLQARAYESLYYAQRNLSYNDDYDLFFVKKTDTYDSITEMHLISLEQSKVISTYSINNSIGEQILSMLKKNQRSSYVEIFAEIKTVNHQFNESNCGGLKDLLVEIKLPFEPYQKPPHTISVEGAEYYVQQKEDEFGIVLTSIDTSSESLPIIDQMLLLKEKLKECRHNKN